MTCPGVHCPGCAEGQSLAITGGLILGLVLAAETIHWVAERVFWIGGTMAVCVALSVTVSMWLEGRADRRGRDWGAARGIYSRADVVLPEAVRGTAVAAASHPAIAPTYVLNFCGTDSGDMAARVIRAIPGTAGDELTEGK